MYDLILAHGIIYDGLGNPAKRQDVAIKGDRIAALGNLSSYYSSHKIIDVKNLVISPGFIDIHSHSDVYYLIHPQAESKIRQGVTTEVIGNCGGSAAPLCGSFKTRRRQEWEKVGVKVTWNSFKEYIDLLSNQGIAVNVVPLVGHGNIRGVVKGFSNRPLTQREQKKMQNILYKALDQGAWGLSTGLIYIPGMYADTKELIDLIKISADCGRIHTTHIRGEGDSLIEAIREAVTIAEETGVNLQISHLKTGSPSNWNKLSTVFRIIEDGKKKGLKIHCDRYPYIASNTDLDVMLPDWFNKMSLKKRKQGLFYYRDKLIEYLRNDLERGWQDMVWIGKTNSRVNKWTQGLSISEIARKKAKEPEEVVLELLKREDFQVQALFFCMNEENLNRILKKPYVMIGSDSSLRTVGGGLAIGHPHPRTFGTFPRVIYRYTQRPDVHRGDTEKAKLTLSKAIWKMTGMPAEKLGVKNRGRVEEDAYADLVVFDPKKIKDRATYKRPFQYPEGIKFVLINGEIVFENGASTGRLPGRVLLK